MKYVLGHANPDTDTTVSALLVADLFSHLYGVEFKAARSGELNKETEYVLNKFGFSIPGLPELEEAEDYVLVDHNEESQFYPGLSKDKILAIIDHHKLGGLSLPNPIKVLIEPVGSTATVVSQMFKEAGKEISRENASLIVAGIVSDTLKFKSPTTTRSDRECAESLAEEFGIDIESLAGEMFKAKSDLAGIDISRVLTADYKNYQIGQFKIGFGVFETADAQPVLERKNELVAALTAVKAEAGLDYIFFGIVDIINEMTYLILLTEKEAELAAEVYKGEKKENILIVPGMVSRKKQMIPPLEQKLNG